MKNNIKTQKTNKSQTLDSFKTIMNPTTGKMVQSGGQLGKKLIKDYKADTIYNPLTKKQVKIGGSVGKKVLSMYRGGYEQGWGFETEEQKKAERAAKALAAEEAVRTERAKEEAERARNNVIEIIKNETNNINAAWLENENYLFELQKQYKHYDNEITINNQKLNNPNTPPTDIIFNKNDKQNNQRIIKTLHNNTTHLFEIFNSIINDTEQLKEFVLYMYFRSNKKFVSETMTITENADQFNKDKFAYSQPIHCVSSMYHVRNECKHGLGSKRVFYPNLIEAVQTLYETLNISDKDKDINVIFNTLQTKFLIGRTVYEKLMDIKKRNLKENLNDSDIGKGQGKYIYKENMPVHIKAFYELCVRYLILNNKINKNAHVILTKNINNDNVNVVHFKF